MSFVTQNKDLEAKLKAAMAGAYPSIGIQFENAPTVQPEGGWVAPFLMDGKARQTELGSRTIDRHVGVLQVDVFMPAQTGTLRVREVAEFIGNVFRKQTVYLGDGARVIYRIPSFITRGPQNGFYGVCMRINYWRDEARQ